MPITAEQMDRALQKSRKREENMTKDQLIDEMNRINPPLPPDHPWVMEEEEEKKNKKKKK